MKDIPAARHLRRGLEAVSVALEEPPDIRRVTEQHVVEQRMGNRKDNALFNYKTAGETDVGFKLPILKVGGIGGSPIKRNHYGSLSDGSRGNEVSCHYPISSVRVNLDHLWRRRYAIWH